MTKENANAQAALILQIMREELPDFAGIRNALIERAEELRSEDETDYTDEEAAALIVKNINKYEGWLAFTVFYDDNENYWWRAGNDLIGVITDGSAMLDHYAECTKAGETVKPWWLEKDEELEEFLGD
jgi:hypothetical protein